VTALPGRCAGCSFKVTFTRGRWRDDFGVIHDCATPRKRVCGKRMPMYGETCARRPGHRNEHRSRYAMDNQRTAKAARAA
jgi:hypothetical protein